MFRHAIKIAMVAIVLSISSFAFAGKGFFYYVEETYEGLPVEETGKTVTVVAGVDVAKLGYSNVLRYALTEGRYLYFIAAKKSAKGEELAFVEHDFETGKQIVIWTSPRAAGQGKSGIYMPNFMIQNRFASCAILMYADEVYTDKYYKATTYVKVFKKDGRAGVYKPFGEHVVGESSVSLEKKDGKKYRYLAVDGDVNTPAKIAIPRITILRFDTSTDFHTNSMFEIVVWEKVYTSRHVNDSGSDFVLDEENFFMMYASRSERLFDSYRKIKLSNQIKEDLLKNISGSMGFSSDYR